MAVKTCGSSHSALLDHEKSILQQLKDCPQIIECFGGDFSFENGEKLYNLFLEYAMGGSLADKLKNFGHWRLLESEVRRHTESILQGLQCIHENGFVHCDLKLQNVLLCQNDVAKIADFGLTNKSGEKIVGFELRAIDVLQANYRYLNEAAIRTVLRYRNRDCHDLLGYTPTYKYSAPRRSKVTDFLRAPSPPPDPTLPDVPYIRLTEAKEMAKRSRIKNLIIATSTEIPSIQTCSPAAGQPSRTVVALASPAARQTSRDNRRAGKRPRADPSAELVAELNTEQPAVTADPIPPWRP
ncbi:mitogen-activated protein kinase kinase 1-like [Camellia sinensis]|uniref:mitogen-activated protein kinase kinase 1-like n=1 Tax=Camellia sinensis TaxID=4442 RepID=UPI001035DE7E|nr:mitogen-activated protein kinase kinase 1-like [Camellia sinensis]